MVTEHGNSSASTVGEQTTQFVAKYRGVIVWKSPNRPLQQLRALRQGEHVEVLREEGSEWFNVRLTEGEAGFVQRNSLRPFDHALDTLTDGAPKHVAYGGQEGGSFAGAPLVATGLAIFAWLAAIGGQLIGIGAAASYECSGLISDCSSEGSSRIFLYASIAIPSFIAALYAWGVSYCISLLLHLREQA